MNAIRHWIKKHFGKLLYHRQVSSRAKKASEKWLSEKKLRPVAKLSDASYDLFTYHGEDGILLYLLSCMKDVPLSFVDIGAGDCIKSNCANLAVHHGGKGIFIDQNNKQLAIGKNFYKKIANHVKFICASVNTENINTIIRENINEKNIGLLSIDIDGNDYWIWEAIDFIQPRIVIIEAKVEFGYKDIIVPYGPANHHSANKSYNGASVAAMQKLGIKKGYKLVGANSYGYNLFFVKNDEPFAEASIEQILSGNEIKNSFYPESFFTGKKFITA